MDKLKEWIGYLLLSFFSMMFGYHLGVDRSWPEQEWLHIEYPIDTIGEDEEYMFYIDANHQIFRVKKDK